MGVGKCELSFLVEIGTNNRYTIPPQIIKALNIESGDILQLTVAGITRKGGS
jgi:bifunctional DNA-binding transcriptional regulator/antitoxin component of YhaV-PrlF toxin-antitoxin module